MDAYKKGQLVQLALPLLAGRLLAATLTTAWHVHPSCVVVDLQVCRNLPGRHRLPPERIRIESYPWHQRPLFYEKYNICPADFQPDHLFSEHGHDLVPVGPGTRGPQGPGRGRGRGQDAGDCPGLPVDPWPRGRGDSVGVQGSYSNTFPTLIYIQCIGVYIV